jgi:hypothetical protein
MRRWMVNTDSDVDHDGFSHYIDENDMMNGLVFGAPAIALCGKVWVPQQDGSDFPMCIVCEDAFNKFFGEVTE